MLILTNDCTPIHIKKIGQGSPLVWFHGFGFDASIFETLIPLLSKKYTFYLVDLPGFGQTPVMDWPQFKKKLRQQLPDSYGLIGWSMGGLWATRLVCEGVPVTHLINICSSPCFVKKKQWPGIDTSILQQFYQQILNAPQKTLSQFIASQTGQLYGGQLSMPTGLYDGLDTLLHWDLVGHLSAIQVPVFYLFGRLDRSYSRIWCMGKIN